MDSNFEEEYTTNKIGLKRLESFLVSNVDVILSSAGIEHFIIKSRIKTIESIKKKIAKKKYSNPLLNIMDIIGIRVVVMQIYDVTNVEMYLRRYFGSKVDEVNSINKNEILEIDRVGYRSVHLIIKDVAINQIFLSDLMSKIKVEIQIRTTLSDLWAQLEHSRSYKGQFVSNKLKREFGLFAGTFELLDHNFYNLMRRSDELNAKAVYKALFGSEINSTTLLDYVEMRFENLVDIFEVDTTEVEAMVNEVILFFGSKCRIEDFDFLLRDNFIHRLKRFYFIRNSESEINLILIIRSIMIIHDYDKYFSNSWNKEWNEWSTNNDFYDFFFDFGINWADIKSKYGVDLFSRTKIDEIRIQN